MPAVSREAVFRTLAALRLPRLLTAGTRLLSRVPVLCLHRVSDHEDPFWPPMRIQVFDELMAYIRRSFEVLPLSSADRGPTGSRPALVLSFDDGYADFYENALPILVRHGLPAVHSVVVGCIETGEKIWTQRLNDLFTGLWRRLARTSIEVLGRTYQIHPDLPALRRTNLAVYQALLGQPHGVRAEVLGALEERLRSGADEPGDSRMMTWAQIGECQRSGVAIGSHTMTHDSLKTITDQALLRTELRESRRVLAERLGTDISAVAFPNGQHSADVVREALAAGYRYLLSTGDRPARERELRSGSVVPRILVYHDGLYENILNVAGLHPLLRGAAQILRADSGAAPPKG